ncbi:MAG: amidohydrolase family protein [Myxococcota bacterium]|nr:amidohydrolase family protein [Myxococcota bacterium]
MATRAIDGWVNVTMGEVGRPAFLERVATDTFKQGDDFFRNYSVDEMLEVMDEIGVERAILTTELRSPSEYVLSFTEAHPERFSIGVQLDPRGGMKTLRALESLTGSQPVAVARITPFLLDLPPNHAVYYPVYAKCIELGLPITINTGIPGPPVPGECQHPMFLDRVCLHFPELKLVMAHGADPWWNEAIRLMIKYRNLSLMTSAYLPKYFPPELLNYMNTRGRRKILFASDHPVIQIKRCVEEAEKLDLRPGVLDAFLYENAARLFFPDSVREGGEGA